MGWSDLAGVSSGGDRASAALDNLVAVAINTSLVSDTDATDNLGSQAIKWLQAFLNRLTIEEAGSTSTPASGDVALYAKADGLLYSKDDAGNEVLVSGGDAFFYVELADVSGTGVSSIDIQNLPATSGSMKGSGAVLPGTDDVTLLLRLNGYSGAADYQYAGVANFGATSVLPHSTGDTSYPIAPNMGLATRQIGNGGAEGCGFTFDIPNYAENIASSQYRKLSSQCAWKSAQGNYACAFVGGELSKAEAVNRVTVLCSSGTFSGRIRLFGEGK